MKKLYRVVRVCALGVPGDTMPLTRSAALYHEARGDIRPVNAVDKTAAAPTSKPKRRRR